jgi:hypothetical protein
MAARLCVFLDQTSELCGLKMICAANQCWPQTAMHKGYFAGNEPTDKNFPGSTNSASHAEDFFAARMRPPTAANCTARNSTYKGGCGAASGLQHDAVLADKGDGFVRGQLQAFLCNPTIEYTDPRVRSYVSCNMRSVVA